MGVSDSVKRAVARKLIHEAMERAKRQMCNGVIPVYGQSADSKVTHLGSAFLLKHREASFCVTAAHLVDDRRKYRLLIPMPSSLLVELRGDAVSTVAPKANRDNDRYDIAVVKLDDELARQLPQTYFISPSECSSETILNRGHHCMVFGFPNARNANIDAVQKVVRNPMRLSYGGVARRNDKIAFKLGLKGNDNLLIRYTTKSQDEHGNRVTALHPRGVSGGMILDLGHIEDRSFKPLLAGVFIEYFKQHSSAVGTKIEIVLQIIERAFCR